MAEAGPSLGVHGACGRMGLRLIQLISEDPDACLGCAIERPGHPRLGEDAGTLAGIGKLEVALVPLGELPGKIDAIIDFSHPTASIELARFCGRSRIPLVVGTTGFEAAQREQLLAVSESIPLLISPNMSRAVNLLMRLVAETARALGPVADIEIVEHHHRLKKDAPSGTALRLAEIAGEAAGIRRCVHGRDGQVGERPHGEIGIHAVRAGDEPGEHRVIFGLRGESIELRHHALNRDGFVRGAIDAAKYLAGKPAGVYSMSAVLEGDPLARGFAASGSAP
ncbi:MAG: 4-hydroxy-tetrahydrodipicolinate reductase [Isosphaeraceae bacterium]